MNSEQLSEVHYSGFPEFLIFALLALQLRQSADSPDLFIPLIDQF